MEELQSYSAPLVGKQLLSVEKKDYSWFFVFDGDLRVVSESPWRLIHEDRIVVTSEDHGHKFGLPAPVDAASRVVSTIAIEWSRDAASAGGYARGG